MSYLATGDVNYRMDANGRCVDAMNNAVDKSLCAPTSGIMKTLWDALSKPTPIKASDIPVPASKVASVKFSGSVDPWRVSPASAKPAAAKTADAAPSSGMPGWVLPVAIGGGALVLVLVLSKSKP